MDTKRTACERGAVFPFPRSESCAKVETWESERSERYSARAGVLTSRAVSDEALALEILRYAAERGLVPVAILSRVTDTRAEQTGTTTRDSASELLRELLAGQKLTLEQVRELKEQVSAAWITDEGAGESEPMRADEKEPPQAPLPPDRYEIEGLIGRGGMGQVYKTRDLRLNRLVALKFLHIADDMRARRLFREARAQARIQHPHVCQVYDVGQQNGQLYIAMEYHTGESLRTLRPTLRLEEKVLLIKQVAEALQAAHSLGIIHRDVKSTNILAQRTDSEGWHAVLLDFGLAQDQEAGDQLTGSGALLGTPAYMSPEQLRGDRQQIDRRSDVYAAGVVLYELLSGAPPFVGDAQHIAWRIVHEEVTPLRVRSASIPQDLETIVMTCLQKEARHRYPSAQALADDLGRFLAGEPIHARRASTVLRARRFVRRHFAPLGIMALLVLSGGGLLGVSIREQQKADARARLAQWLGREVELNDMFLRMAYALPLHDVRQEEAVVRARVATIQQRIAEMPQSEVALAHYAMGRSLLMLREYDSAIAHLQAARSAGDASPEVGQMLGRALAARFQHGQGEFDGWLGDDWIEERLARLRDQYLTPARQLLEAGQTVASRESLLSRAVLALLRDEYDQGLELAGQVLAAEPWRSEAKKLIGDIHAARSAQLRRRGQHQQSLDTLGKALEQYQAALHMARSDPTYVYSVAKLYLNQLSLELYLGRSPVSTHERLLRISDELQYLQPESTESRVVRLTAASIMIRYHSDRRESLDPIEAQALADLAFVRRLPMSSLMTQLQALLYASLGEARLNRGQPLGELPALAEAAAKQAAASPEHPSRGYQILGDWYALLGYKNDIDGMPIYAQLSKAIEAYKAGWRLSPKRDTLIEGALLVYRRAVLGLAARDELQPDWLAGAEEMGRLGLRGSQAPFVMHHHLGGVYVDAAEVWLLDGRVPEAEGLLDKAKLHIEKAIALLPTHAPSHADLSSLYRLQAVRVLRTGGTHEEVASLLRAAQAAMDHSMALNPRDPLVLVAHAKLLLLSAEQEQRMKRSIDALLTQLGALLKYVPRAGWLAAAVPFLESEATRLRAQALTASQRTPLYEQARVLLSQALQHRPKWRLAQRRLAELSPAPAN